MASVLVASLATACGAAPSESQRSIQVSRGPTPSPSPIALTDYPGGFPTSYANDVDPRPALLLPVEGGLRHDSSGTLRADDGTSGTYTAAWIENRVAAAEVMCGGVTYPDLFTAEAPVVTMEVSFPEWGHAALVTTNRVVVYQSSRNGSSPAVCDEVTGGTYDFKFTGGPILQLKSGTWGWATDGRLVFDESQASPGSSPS